MFQRCSNKQANWTKGSTRNLLYLLFTILSCPENIYQEVITIFDRVIAKLDLFPGEELNKREGYTYVVIEVIKFYQNLRIAILKSLFSLLCALISRNKP